MTKFYIGYQLKKIFSKFNKQFIKSIFAGGLTTSVKVITGFLLSKAIAILLGPSGMALTGQFYNFCKIIYSIATGGIGQGVAKYFSEKKNNPHEQKLLISTAFFIMSIFAFVEMILIIVFYEEISFYIFSDLKYGNIILILALTLNISAFTNLINYIINGSKDIKNFVRLNIINNIFNFLITIVLIFKFKLIGVLLAWPITICFKFIVNVIVAKQKDWYQLIKILKKPDKSNVIKLLKFSLMALISFTIIPVGQIIIRNNLINNFSLDYAGYWQAMIRISDYYLLPITASIAVYYLPRLSELKEIKDIRKEILSAMSFILPVILIFQLSVFFTRNYIIRILLDEKFQPMNILFQYQLIGDFFRISGLMIINLMIAKAKTKLYIFSEICFGSLHIILALVFIHFYGFIGTTYSHAVTYFLYLIFVLIVFRHIFIFPTKNGHT